MGVGVGRSCFHFWVKLFADDMTAFLGCHRNAYGRGIQSWRQINKRL